MDDDSSESDVVWTKMNTMMLVITCITFVYMIVVGVLTWRIYRLVKFTDMPQLMSILCIFASIVGKSANKNYSSINTTTFFSFSKFPCLKADVSISSVCIQPDLLLEPDRQDEHVQGPAMAHQHPQLPLRSPLRQCTHF